MTQGNFLESLDRPVLAVTPIPFAKGSETSREAAKSKKESAGTDRAKVFALIKRSGWATCDEIEVLLGLCHQNASARI